MPQGRNNARKKTPIRHEPIVRTFARRLREARRASGLSQLELARLAQINVSYVTRLENGKTAPGIDLLARLANALGVSVSSLLPEDELDARAVLQERARTRFEAVVSRAGTDTLQTLIPILAMMDEVLGRERK